MQKERRKNCLLSYPLVTNISLLFQSLRPSIGPSSFSSSNHLHLAPLITSLLCSYLLALPSLLFLLPTNGVKRKKKRKRVDQDPCYAGGKKLHRHFFSAPRRLISLFSSPPPRIRARITKKEDRKPSERGDSETKRRRRGEGKKGHFPSQISCRSAGPKGESQERIEPRRDTRFAPGKTGEKPSEPNSLPLQYTHQEPPFPFSLFTPFPAPLPSFTFHPFLSLAASFSPLPSVLN